MMHSDPRGSRLGMWIFLMTELLLFGGLFLLYAVYSNIYPKEFSDAAKELSTPLGSLNTVVLLTSSLFVALSVEGIRNNAASQVLGFLFGTIACSGVFLRIKMIEWAAKFDHGLFPTSAELLLKPKGTIVFFNLYFFITGLHAIHVIIGAFILGIVMWYVYRRWINASDYVFLENSGLYWHLVDLIWIFIFPLFYLVVP